MLPQLDRSARQLSFGKRYPAIRSTRLTALIVAVALLVLPETVAAQQSLDEAVAEKLDRNCTVLRGPDDPSVVFGPELAQICSGNSSTTGGGGVSAGGFAGTSQQLPVIIEQRLSSLKDEDDEREPTKVAALGDMVFINHVIDHAVDSDNGSSVFISGHYTNLNREVTSLENGYSSDVWEITTGVDYRFSRGFLAGLALTLRRWEGEFDDVSVIIPNVVPTIIPNPLDGGGFQTNAFGVVAYASLSSRLGFLGDLILQYTLNDVERTRLATWKDGFAPINNVVGSTSGDYRNDELNVRLRIGYDYVADTVTIGPRAGLGYVYSKSHDFEETGVGQIYSSTGVPIPSSVPSGLELAFDEDKRESLQSSLGFEVTASFRSDSVRTRLFANWLHEFKDDLRTINVRFVQDNRVSPQVFGFQTGEVDQNYFEAGAGVSFLFDSGLQPFVSVRTLLGHSFYDSTTVSAGLRKTF